MSGEQDILLKGMLSATYSLQLEPRLLIAHSPMNSAVDQYISEVNIFMVQLPFSKSLTCEHMRFGEEYFRFKP